MYRRFTYKNNYEYIDILPQLIDSYNKSLYRVYRIRKQYRDLLDDEIDGIFYEAELQKVYHNEVDFLVNKVLKTRKRNGIVEKFVSWLGYPDKFNSWVLEADIRRLLTVISDETKKK